MKMMIKSKALLGITAVMLCLSMTACNETSAPETTPSGETVSAAESTLPPQESETALTEEDLPEEDGNVSSAAEKETAPAEKEPPTEDSNVSENENLSPAPADNTKLFTEDDRWIYLDRESLTNDTFDPAEDGSRISANFVHHEIGGQHEGVRYYLEYIDNDNFYITFDNSGNESGRCVEMFIYDVTFPNDEGEDWSLYSADYFIDAGTTVTKQYRIDGKMKEERPLRFGIAIDDRGFNYSDDKADVTEKTGEYSLDITYYGIDNTAEYYDINGEFVTEEIPEGFRNFV